MLFQGILTSALLLVGGVHAGYNDGSAPQGMVTMHQVTVGKDGQLAYSPEKVTAQPGDMVQFTFYPKVPKAPACLLRMLGEHHLTYS